MTAHTWRNWSGTVTAHPARIVAPRDEGEVADLVRSAGAHGQRVRVAGAGHSFTPAAATEGTLLQLDLLDGLEHIGQPAPDGSRLVRVGAGIRLRDLTQQLAARDLAMENMGDIDAQSLAGAISTGTHGTGARLGGLATQVHALRLVTAEGQIRDISPERDADLFELARLGLGTAGVLTAITLRCVPAFTLTATEAPLPLDHVLESLGELLAADHFEFYWFPRTEVALTKTNTRDGSCPALPAARRILEDEVLSNGLFEVTNRLATAVPALTPQLNRFAARALSARTYTATSPEVFVSPRRVRFTEMEYAIAADAVVPALREIQQWLHHSQENVPFPIEVRFAAADQVWLSTAYARPTAYVAVHQYHRLSHARYFRAVEAIMRDYDGRPHWGKLHRRRADDLASAYPRWADAHRVRTAVDPGSVFANSYTERVFSPATGRG
ncbi:D-arabinono-1,4-lactone oxidase [Ruania halotolerans]|uniref:D-arabinono-1,4-lactone oxidase n=1 Tax=Ruania halotolerans TaxID=2897773 RepID=UPI001E2AE4AF|nr:D-arabinono-1,4-lactone oxidase [Ruania halotolerans]UFU05939.1 FAD-binding protein [Ruania halotolerans]